MKRIIFLAFFAGFALAATAQIKIGLRTGLSSTDLSPRDLFARNEQLKLAIKDANYGYHIGLFAQLKLAGFFLQPEVLFNSNKVDFAVDDLSNNLPEMILSEKYRKFDIPIFGGLKFGPLRLGTGPVAHVFLSSSSSLFDITGYEQNFDTINWGWQAGLGLNLWKVIIDLKYETNFDKFGEHIVIDGTSYKFNKSPSRLILSVGISF